MQERTVICQGIVCPTLYNAQTRANGTCYAQSDWFSRPMYTYKDSLYSGDGRTKWLEYIEGRSVTLLNEGRGGMLFNIHNMGLPGNETVCSEVRGSASEDSLVDNTADVAQWAEIYRDTFLVDYNTVTFHSPDIEFDEGLKDINLDSENIKFRPVGKVSVKGTYGKLTANISNWYGDEASCDQPLLEILPIETEDGWWCDGSSFINYPAIIEKVHTSASGTYYKGEALYPWHSDNIYSYNGTSYGKIENKILSNLKVCWNNLYNADYDTSYGISNTKLVDSEVPQLYDVTPKDSGISGAYYTNAVDMAVLHHDDYFLWNTLIVKSPLFNTFSRSWFKHMYDPWYFQDEVVDPPGPTGQRDGIIITGQEGYWRSNVDPDYAVTNISPTCRAYDGELTDETTMEDGGDYVFYFRGGGMLRLNPGSASDVRYLRADSIQTDFMIYGTYTGSDSNGTFTITEARIMEEDGHAGAHIPLYILKGPVNLDLQTTTSSEGVSIRYKSGPHIVFSFNYLKSSNKWTQTVLPRYYNGSEDFSYTPSAGNVNFWHDSSEGRISQNFMVDVTGDDLWDAASNGYFILGELRRTSVPNRFGGTSESAYALNKWVPCSEEVTLSDTTGGALIIDSSSASIGGTGNHTLILEDGDGVSYAYEDLVGTEYQTVAITASSGVEVPNRLLLCGIKGDTYFQRYDHLKTYPYSQTDTNSIVDIVSFCCETHVNLNGRYDKNKGLRDNTMITPNIFNQLNLAYTQQDNWFQQSYLIEDATTAVQAFPNQITWSIPKSYGEKIDTWTSISLGSVLDLDGDKGSLKALRRWNDKIIFFQEHGLGFVNYNERTVMNTESGLPVQIANSNKVEGKTYLSTVIGCQTPQTITETRQNLYFADNSGHSIYQMGSEGLASVSELSGMSSYLRGVSVEKAFSDLLHNEVYFTTVSSKDSSIRKSLCFNEQLQKFVSFFDYGDASVLVNIDDKTLAVSDTDGKLWELFAGTDYNKIFGVYRDYYVTYRVAPREENELPSDNVFDYIEYQGDFYDGLTGMPIQDTEDASDIRPDRKFLFDTMEVSNEYQNTEAELSSFNTKKKFRIWRTQFPRANKQGRSSASNAIHGERIRNPWIKLTLKKNNSAAGAANKDAEMRLYNLSVFSTKY